MLEVNQQLQESIDAGLTQMLNSNVLLRRDPKPESSLGGVLLPETQYVAPDWVTILAVPKTVSDRFSKNRKCVLEAGVRAFVRPSAGQKLWDLDKNLQVCHHRDIVAIEKDGVIIPFDHYILIEKPERSETLGSGLIIIPESIRLDSENQGTVLSIGDQVTDVNIGDTVVFGPESGLELDKSKRVFALPVDEVLAILDE